jgi:hypothetical protein
VFAPLGFHKTDGFRLAHVPPLVLFPSGGKTGRELQLDQLSADDGIYIHSRKIIHVTPFDKPGNWNDPDFNQLAQLGFTGAQHVRDLWRQSDLPDVDAATGVLKMMIPVHGVVLYRLTAVK